MLSAKRTARIAAAETAEAAAQAAAARLAAPQPALQPQQPRFHRAATPQRAPKKARRRAAADSRSPDRAQRSLHLFARAGVSNTQDGSSPRVKKSKVNRPLGTPPPDSDSALENVNEMRGSSDEEERERTEFHVEQGNFDDDEEDDDDDDDEPETDVFLRMRRRESIDMFPSPHRPFDNDIGNENDDEEEFESGQRLNSQYESPDDAICFYSQDASQVAFVELPPAKEEDAWIDKEDRLALFESMLSQIAPDDVFHPRNAASQAMLPSQVINKAPNEGLLVVSFFNGVGAVLPALFKAGFKVETILYWEIEPGANTIFNANFGPHASTKLEPNAFWKNEELIRFDEWRREIRMVLADSGDMTDKNTLTWSFVKQHLGGRPPDLLCGGSPCDDLSVLGLKAGINDGIQSRLFFNMMWVHNAILAGVKIDFPGHEDRIRFFYENVASMSAADRRVMDNKLLFEPIRVDAKNYSPAYRNRLYWTNFFVHYLTCGKHQNALDFLEPGWQLCSGETKVLCITSGNIGGDTNIYTGDLDKNNQPRYNRVRKGKLVRSLYAREAGTMMGFPKGYFNVQGANSNDRSNGIGKSWSVFVVADIFGWMEESKLASKKSWKTTTLTQRYPNVQQDSPVSERRVNPGRDGGDLAEMEDLLKSTGFTEELTDAQLNALLQYHHNCGGNTGAAVEMFLDMNILSQQNQTQ